LSRARKVDYCTALGLSDPHVGWCISAPGRKYSLKQMFNKGNESNCLSARYVPGIF